MEHANSIQMKEKNLNDMKKEIKKLQRLRDFFRQNLNSQEVKDKSRLQEAKRRIEDQMVTFRELEKEYKLKKLSKSQYQTHNEIEGKFMFDSNEDDSHPDGAASSEEDPARASAPRRSPLPDYSDGSEGEAALSDERQRPSLHMRKHFTEDDEVVDASPVDKEALVQWVGGELRETQANHEAEINSMRNMRKGSVKKNKDRIALLMARIAQLKQVRDRIDELNIGLDYIEPRKMRPFRHQARKFLAGAATPADDEPLRQTLLSEIETLIEYSEQARLTQAS